LRSDALLRQRPWACLLALACSGAAAADYTGIVHARHHLTLSVSVPGIIAKVLVEPGRRVGAQEALLLLDDRLQVTEEQRRRTVLEDNAEIKATDERLKIVQALAEDARKLVGTRGAISREEAARTELDLVATRGRLDQLQAQKRRERLELQVAEQERAQRRLLAPVAGVVTKVQADLGEWARPGDPMVELVDTSVLHLQVNVPAAAARSVREGASLPISFEASLNLPPVNGNVVFISPAIDAASGLVEMRLRFANPNGRVPPGVKAMARIDGGAAR
jgi:RND family efflux transporter MFP subunit